MIEADPNNSQCSAYDCEYVSLAISLDITLFTMDKKVLSEFADIARSFINLNL